MAARPLIAAILYTLGLAAALGWSGVAAAQQACIDTPEGRVCKVQQPLIGYLVATDTQRDLGLVTLGGGSCSGTLINQYWVLTADHCVTTDGTIGGPTDMTANLAVSAAWTNRTAIPSRVVRDWQPGHDVALLYLGAGNLGPVSEQFLAVLPATTSDRITAYGQGIFALATGSGAAAMPTQADGQYRTATFTPSAASGDAISFNVTADGQIIAGGDSGGPDFIIAPDGTNIGIGAVHSRCSLTRIPGLAPDDDWTWVNRISSCTSAAIANIRQAILTVARERPRPAVSVDFNRDGRTDILWHNETTGETQVWFMELGSRIGRATVTEERGAAILVGSPWGAYAAADFDRDGQTDILWANGVTGAIQIWFMNGTSIGHRSTVFDEQVRPIPIGPPWRIVGAGDMNRDGYADIVWYNEVTGVTHIWFMRQEGIIGRANVVDEGGAEIRIGRPWNLAAVGDMDGNGSADLVWHSLDGSPQIWFMDGARIVNRPAVRAEGGGSNAFAAFPWRIVNALDYDLDGIGDLLWYNEQDGGEQIWLLDVGTIKGRIPLDANRDGGGVFVQPPWRIVSREAHPVEGDFDHDYRPDLLWHNDATGETQIWFMSLGSRIGRATVVDERGAPILITAPWRIAASGDFDGDRQTDILWANDAAGEIQLWQMSGWRIANRLTVVAETGAPERIGPPWDIIGAGDMNADGRADLIWANRADGAMQIWLMAGNRVTGRVNVVDETGTPIFIGPPWRLAAITDVDGNGMPDFVWHNEAEGWVQTWFMNGGRIVNRLGAQTENNGLPAQVGAPWRLAGSNDFDRDGLADLIWHNQSDGAVQIWLMNTHIKGRWSVDADRDGGGAFAGPPWRLAPQ